MEFDRAKILLMTGDQSAAVATLNFILQQGGYFTIEQLKMDPFWDQVRERDDFKALINNPDYQIHQDDN